MRLTREGSARAEPLLLIPAAVYLALAWLFAWQLPMHEEIIHLRDTSAWKSALEYPWHPPTYVLLGRLVRFIAGDLGAGPGGYRVLYALGMAAAVANVYLTARVLKAISPRDTARESTLAGSALLAAMPVFVHGSLLLEMEPVVLTPLILLAVLYYLQGEAGERGARFYAMVGIFFGLAMWAKYFATPLLIMAALFAYELSCRRADAVRNTLIVGATASLVFFPGYLLYSEAFIPGTNSLGFLFLEKPGEGAPLFASGRALVAAGTKLLAFNFWLSPFFMLLFLILLYKGIRNWGGLGSVRFFYFGTAAVFLFYLFLHPYPFAELKYFFPMFPLVAVMMVTLYRREADWSSRPALLVLVPASAAAFFFLVGDPMYETLSRFRNGSFDGLMRYAAVYAGVNIAVFAAAYGFVRSTVGGRGPLVRTLAMLTAGYVVSLYACQATGGYQTRVQYGETGARETVEFVKSNVPVGAKALVPGDIAYYSGVEFEEAVPLLEGFSESGDWEWVVAREVDLARLPVDERKRLGEYGLVGSFGSYRVLKRSGVKTLSAGLGR